MMRSRSDLLRAARHDYFKRTMPEHTFTGSTDLRVDLHVCLPAWQTTQLKDMVFGEMLAVAKSPWSHRLEHRDAVADRDI